MQCIIICVACKICGITELQQFCVSLHAKTPHVSVLTTNACACLKMVFSGQNTGRRLTNSGGTTRQSQSLETKSSLKRRTVNGGLQEGTCCGESSFYHQGSPSVSLAIWFFCRFKAEVKKALESFVEKEDEFIKQVMHDPLCLLMNHFLMLLKSFSQHKVSARLGCDCRRRPPSEPRRSIAKRSWSFY